MKWYSLGEKIVSKIFFKEVREGDWFLSRKFISSLTEEQKRMLIEDNLRLSAKGATILIFTLIVILVGLVVKGW